MKRGPAKEAKVAKGDCGPSPRWIRRQVRWALRHLLPRVLFAFALEASAATNQVIIEAPLSGLSNLTYYIHAQIPPSASFSLFGLTTNRTFTFTNGQPNAVYAGVAVGQSNKLWQFVQLGLALPDPDPQITNRLLRLMAPRGALALESTLDGATWQRVAVLSSTSPPVNLTQRPSQMLRVVRPPPLPGGAP